MAGLFPDRHVFHHYSIIQSSFTALQILCALPVHPAIPQALAAPDRFPVSVVSPFPEGHRVGTTRMETIRLVLSLSNVHFSFLHAPHLPVAWWLLHFYH